MSRIFSVILVVVILLGLGTAAFVFALRVRTKHEAESLLHDLKALRIGESTTDDALKIMHRYGGRADDASSSDCAAADAAYVIRIANDTINRVGTSVPFTRRIGFRPSGVVTTFLLKNGRLCYVSYSVGTMPEGGKKQLSVQANIHASESEGLPTRFGQYWIHYSLSRDTYLDFMVRTTTTASPEEQNHAFDFDLSCLGRIAGCRSACEVMPSAWRDYEANARAEGVAVPVSDLRCRTP